MFILGIETSCDETAAAVVENGTKIISNIIASSQSLHAKYGGIIPDKAAREQLKSIIPVVHEAFSSASLTPNDIDAIGVTIGPGLIGSLLIGIETAKSLALAWNKPLIPVNHLIGHIYANWLGSSLPTVHRSSKNYPLSTMNHEHVSTMNLPQFPALVLIVSGGHSELVLMKNHGQFQYLGGTRDDAAGECFDKCARLLDLGYPGGPAIEKAAIKKPETRIKNQGKILPRPLINNISLDFSFSGLKTALKNNLLDSKFPILNSHDWAFELQKAVCDVLVQKTVLAAEKYQVKSILLAGGVAANKKLREKMAAAIKQLGTEVKLFIPPIPLCTDNAAYIASAAYFNNQSVAPTQINAIPDLEIKQKLAFSRTSPLPPHRSC